MAKKIDVNGLDHYHDKVSAMLASEYSSSKTYAVGDYCFHAGTLYECTTAITTAENWTAGHWTAAKLAEDTSALKTAIDTVNDILFETVESTNIFTPTSSRVYPENGTCTIAGNKTISIANVPKNTNVWIYPQDGFSLPVGSYTLCLDSGLYDYGVTVVALQNKPSGGSWTDIVSATGTETSFTVSEAITSGDFRVAFVAGNSVVGTITWSGHIWVNSGEAQEYMPVGGSTQEEKLDSVYVGIDQGVSNAGKFLAVDETGNVAPKNGLSDEIYQYGNLLDYDGVTGGYIKSDGAVQTYNSLWCSDFCEIGSGTLYVYGAQPTQYFAFYNADKSLNASYSTTGAMTKLTSNSEIYKIAVPENAKYFRCTFSYNQKTEKTAWISNSPENPYQDNTYNIDDIYPYTMNPENPCDYSELTVRAFSKVVCIGDSLTYGGFNLADSGTPTGETQSSADLSERYSYPSNFERITGISTTNAGDSGETSVTWYTAHQNDDFSDYDLAIIFLGVNDSAFSVSDADTLSAMEDIVTMLGNARSDMRIAICSCIPAYESSGYQAKGQLILNWAKGLNDPNIIPLDLAQYSHVRPKTSYVAGHCSALGYYMMALDIARYISWYMDKNKRDFRFIQFIGSPDAEWSYD